MKHALAIRHLAFEDAGSLGLVLARRGVSLDYIEAGRDEIAPLDPLGPDLLVVLGGPIGAYEEASYPFLTDELALLGRRLAAGRPTLGICLGAQMIARALGARVYPGGVKEIGWAPLALTAAGRESCLRPLAPEETAVLHWHGDTFELPEDAALLASTAAYPHQAFQWRQTTLALQFHAEVLAGEIERWLIGHACEIAATPGITVPGLRAATRQWGESLERQGRRCFESWLDAVAGG
ncbi:MAG: glutamine amidotransferase [Candidatus Hydrogenedens sp.]|nr:glutamine amidotransferase [Candidatus Hydrogenedens sp.]